MEKKFYLESGKEVHFGDEICIERSKITELGSIKRVTILTVTPDNVEKLLQKGILFSKSTSSHKYIQNLTDCFNIIAKKANMPSTEVNDLYNKLIHIYPASALSMITRVIALDFEHKYNGKISDCPTIYYINTMNGEICSYSSSKINNWGHFAAFRSKEDAKKAVSICKPILDLMYGE